MGTFRPVLFVLSALLIKPGIPPLWAQSPAGAESSPLEVLKTDPASLIGLNLETLLSRFGVPQAVYAARGNETWQDDVIFMYGAADFYVYKDRVWQIKLAAAYGISSGDPRPAVVLTLGEAAEDFADHIVCPLPSRGWPLALRVNLDSSGFVSAVYVYRPDF
jgi:hypothetical protein